MFMLGVLKTISKTVLKYKKTPSHFTARVETERQISFFSFGFACVSEVRHIFQPGKETTLILRKPDDRRRSTQTWRFTEDGRLCCGSTTLCVQSSDGVFGLRDGMYTSY